MDYGILDFLHLIGSLCVFVFGMKIMSDGLQKAAGPRLKGMLAGMTSNRFMGVLTGFLITVLLQTSSGTTVMVVSFVNAGLLTLAQSMGVIMGANIGTTLTAWMISLLGFKVNVLSIAIIGMGFALPFYFSGNKTRKSLAEFVIGFGILFIGIEYLKESVPNISENPEMLAFLETYTQYGFFSILLFVLFGTILTVTVQSSSAATAITLALIYQGYIDFTYAAAIFLGENIGTTITANLAALVGNVHAKRAARFHFIFNIIGVVWVLSIFTPFLGFIDYILTSFFDMSPFVDDIAERGQNMVIAISVFHSLFNILNVIIFIGFLKFLEKLVIKIQPSKGDVDEEFRLKYISAGIQNSSELSLLEAQKEIQMFAKLIDKMSFTTGALLFEKHKNPEKLLSKLNKREGITDNMEVEITKFLALLTDNGLSERGQKQARGMIRMVSELERIGDLFNLMGRNYERMVDLNVKLPEEGKLELKEMLELIFDFIKVMRVNLGKNYDQIDLAQIYAMDKRIDRKRDEILENHYVRLEKGVYSAQAGVIFLDYVNRLEKVGDNIVNIHEAAIGLKLEKKEAKII
ncbi:MAG: Na/Pi cotransporter family protein [Chitinophagaceae bacterium]|nr:MAG: Na/Pi cotransporter family protein [Chitinophagaceae bacterium]